MTLHKQEKKILILILISVLISTLIQIVDLIVCHFHFEIIHFIFRLLNHD